MPTNFSQFAIQLRKEERVVETSLHELVRRVVEEFLIRVTIATPVLTGLARGNWQVGVGSAPSGILPAAGESLSSAQQNAIARARLALAVLPRFPVVLLPNNVFYISFLNDGSSTQAPAGFVELALESTDNRFRTVEALPSRGAA